MACRNVSKNGKTKKMNFRNLSKIIISVHCRMHVIKTFCRILEPYYGKIVGKHDTTRKQWHHHNSHIGDTQDKIISLCIDRNKNTGDS